MIPLFTGSESGSIFTKKLKFRVRIRIHGRNHNTSSMYAMLGGRWWCQTDDNGVPPRITMWVDSIRIGTRGRATANQTSFLPSYLWARFIFRLEPDINITFLAWRMNERYPEQPATISKEQE